MRDNYDEEISFIDGDDWENEDDVWEAPVEQAPRKMRGRSAHEAYRRSDERRVRERQLHRGARKTGASKETVSENAARAVSARTSPMTDLLLLLFKVGLIVIFVLVLMTFFYGITQVRDESMNPAFKEGDLVIYYRLDKDYASQDAIVVDYNGTLQVRRVVAVAGDTVDISADGGLIINGSTQIEDEIYTTTLPYTDGITFPVTVGEGEVFVLGDDRTSAEDSRIYGTVSISATKGAVMTLIRRRGL